MVSQQIVSCQNFEDVSIFFSLCLYVCGDWEGEGALSVCVCVCVCVCVHIYVYVHACVCISCTQLYNYMYKCINVVCLCVSISICKCVHVFICVFFVCARVIQHTGMHVFKFVSFIFTLILPYWLTGHKTSNDLLASFIFFIYCTILILTCT